MASSSVAVLVRICGETLALKLKHTFEVWSNEPLQIRGQGEADLDTATRSKSLQRRHAGQLIYMYVCMYGCMYVDLDTAARSKSLQSRQAGELICMYVRHKILFVCT